MQVIVGLCAVLLMGGGLMLAVRPLHCAGMTLVSTAVMAAALLGGGHVAAACMVAALVMGAFVGPELTHLAISSGAAAIVGVLLRRGGRPDALAAAFSAVLLASHPAKLSSVASAAGMATELLIQAGASTVASTALLLLVPRRSTSFPTHCRNRTDHMAFALAFGPVAIAALCWVSVSAGSMPTLAAVLWLAAGLLATLAGNAVLASHLLADTPARRGAVEARRRERHLQRSVDALSQRLRQAMLERGQLQRELDSARGEVRNLAAQLARNVGIQAHTYARYQALFTHSRDGALFTDARGVVLAAGPGVQPLLGLQPADIIGKPVRSLIPPHHILDHPLDHLGTTAEQAPEGIDAILLARDPATREVRLHVHRFVAGQAAGYLVLIQDAGNMKQAMATLEQARTLEQSAHQSRDLFIATMSHELRTPLHGLIATLDMMRVDESMPPQFEQRLSVARISARALLRIANDILDLTRIESGHIQLEQKPFSLERVIEEVVDESRARADSMALNLEWHVQDTLPPAFIGDATRLKQVVGNLVSNALQYTQAGGARVEVTWDGRQSTIDVIDTGSGIPADKWQAIFDPFVQVPSTRNRRVGGTGLGLPISRRLVQAMGGSLVLARSDANGSVFRICLALPTTEQAAPDENSQRIFNNPHARVLVVEDNPANRYVAEALLTSLDCPATLAENGDEALKALAEKEFDLVLMDCELPGIDGYETTRRARRLLTRHIPIIAMTANAMMDDRQQCLDAGMDDFLPKPFGRQALHAMLCKWLDPEARNRAASANDETASRIALLPALDPSVFEELRESLQWRLQPLRNIRNTFVSSAHNAVQLLDGSRSADQRALRRQLHTLLGSAGMVGARQVEYVARRLQAYVEAGDHDSADACVSLLRDALHHFESEFEHRLQISSDERDWSGRTHGGRQSSGSRD